MKGDKKRPSPPDDDEDGDDRIPAEKRWVLLSPLQLSEMRHGY